MRHRGAGRPTVRSAAAAVLERSLASRRPLHDVLPEASEPFDPRDRTLLTALVLGTLRWLRRIDSVLAGASSRPLAQIDRELLAPLRIGVFQLLFLDRVPAHATVKEAVDEARRRGHGGGGSFVNAVLRRVAASPRLDAWPVEERDPLRRLAVETSHPDLLVRRWYHRFGLQATRSLLEANNRSKPLQLLAFRDRGGPGSLAEALRGEGVETRPASLSPLGLTVCRGDPVRTAAFRRGDFYVQDDASQATALLPPPQPRQSILDAAAAPGGKSLALVAWEPELRPVLADASLARMQIVRSNLARLRRDLPLVVADARRPAIGPGFERVVVDLPCTGTGTLRRHPELKWRLGEEEIDRLAAQGAEMLAGVAPLVRPGGLLVAITCSLEAEENEQVVAGLVGRNPDFAPLELAGLLPETLRPGIRGPGLWRVLTAGDHDGFTALVLRRRRTTLSPASPGAGGTHGIDPVLARSHRW